MNLYFNIRDFFNKFKFKKPKLITVFIIVLFLGMVFGAFSVGLITNNVSQNVNDVFMQNLEIKNSGFNISNFINSFSSSIIYLILIFILSLSFFGSFAIFLVLFIKGFGIGLLSGYIYSMFLLKGILFCIFILFPGIFISLIAIAILSVNSFNFSCNFAKKILPTSDKINLWNEFLIYIKKIFIIILLFFVSSFIDFLLSGTLYKFFKF